MQVSTTSAPAPPHLHHFLCPLPLTNILLGAPRIHPEKPLSLGVKKIYVLKMLLHSFQRNTIQFWRKSYLPRNFLLGHPLFLGAGAKGCHIHLSLYKCTSCIEWNSLCHLITK